jgi:hypothetical protein
MLQRIFIDVACFVDERGVHLRWRGGRGQLNFFRKDLTDIAKREAIVVHVAPPKQRRPILIGDVLAEIGLG